ncbi:MAG: formylglycine-generating enzyme family protein [Thermodesulfobacteriota bacterium]
MKDPEALSTFGALLALLLFGLVSIPVACYAGGTGGGPGKGHAGYAPEGRARIPVAPSDIEQVLVPGGAAALGSDAKEKAYGYAIGGEGARRWRWFDAEAQRRVFVDDFYIDMYPVTQAQYYVFVRETGHAPPFISERDYRRQGFLVHPYTEVAPYLWRKLAEGMAPPAGRLDDPVVLVSVDDAMDYCRWRGGFYPERTFRLPYEDEWEKAARGDDGRYFPWGDTWDDTRANIGRSGPNGTSPVYRYDSGRSPYGVYDMAGNIFEWTGTVAGKGQGRHILKSCSWDDMPGICRAAARHSRPKGSRHILIGFRCASTIDRR